MREITNYILILLPGYTGIRRGQGLGLTWNEVGVKNKTALIKGQERRMGLVHSKSKIIIGPFW